jgi:hypothetical protein
MMLDRLNALLLSAILVLAQVSPTIASQNALLSPTTGTVSGLQLTNNYNNALDSVNTANSGASSPTNQLSGTPSIGNWWLNTTSNPNALGMYDGAQWPVLANLDTSAHAWNVQIGGGAATLASASTVDLCSTPQNYLTISGTTTITSFGSTCPAGVVKLITFSGILQITYNATSLIIPGAASIPATSAGDQATLVSLGSGNWQVATYTPASGAALINPSVDVGTYLFTSAVNVPSSKYLLAYGQAISRVTYATFLAASTITQSVTRTNGSPTLTGFSDTTQIPNGAPVEGSGIPTSTTILSCTSTTCTMSANASSSGTANVQIFPNGDGDGSTTFNMPNCADIVLAGRGNMSGTPRNVMTTANFGYNSGSKPDALGALGGAEAQFLTLTQLPTGINSTNPSPVASYPDGLTSGDFFVTINASVSTGLITGTGTIRVPFSGGSFGFSNTITALTNTVDVTSNNTGGAAHPNIQPTLTANCMVRVLAMIDMPAIPNSLACNDNLPFVADRRRDVA